MYGLSCSLSQSVARADSCRSTNAELSPIATGAGLVVKKGGTGRLLDAEGGMQGVQGDAACFQWRRGASGLREEGAGVRQAETAEDRTI